jgi:hypothetical protein
VQVLAKETAQVLAKETAQVPAKETVQVPARETALVLALAQAMKRQGYRLHSIRCRRRHRLPGRRHCSR